MLHTADILSHWHPAAYVCWVERPILVTRRAVTEEVPRRVDEGIHGVGVTPRGPSTLWAIDVDPVGGRGQRRGSLWKKITARQVRQLNRKLIIGHWDLTTSVAVDDRYRATPIALPTQQPVPQPEDHRTLANSLSLQPGNDRANALLLVGQAIEDVGVDVGAITRCRDACFDRIRSAGGHYLTHRQAKGAGKVQVALIMSRNSHDRPGTVLSQHIVGGVDRDLFTVHRIGSVHSQEDASLGTIGGLPLDLGLVLGLLQILCKRRSLLVTNNLG